MTEKTDCHERHLKAHVKAFGRYYKFHPRQEEFYSNLKAGYCYAHYPQDVVDWILNASANELGSGEIFKSEEAMSSEKNEENAENELMNDELIEWERKWNREKEIYAGIKFLITNIILYCPECEEKNIALSRVKDAGVFAKAAIDLGAPK